MMRFIKQTALAAALTISIWQGPAARAVSPDKGGDLFPDKIVATGKGFEIKQSQVEEAYMGYSGRVVANGGSIPDDQRAMVRSNLLQHLIITQILVQKATPEEKSATKKIVDDALAEARANAPSPEAFENQIKASGMTLSQVRDRAVEEQLAKRVLTRETTNGITVSDAAVKKFYDDNPSKFERPEQVRAAHILISTMDPITQHPIPADQKKEKKKLAQDIKARADKGEDFAALAKQYSDDPGSKNKGGEYTFARGRMVPEFEAAAFSLKPNQISDLVETQYGYHIIKLLEKIPPSTEKFADAAPKIREYLVGSEAEKKLPAYLDKLKADADVKLMAQTDASSSAVK